jgi:hypothetical protein
MQATQKAHGDPWACVENFIRLTRHIDQRIAFSMSIMMSWSATFVFAMTVVVIAMTF